MNLKHITKDLGKFVAKESPQILTVLGVAGIGVTTYLTVKATWKAARQIQHEEIVAKVETGDQGYELNKRAIVEKTWKMYIPAATTGVMTVVCIVAANRVQARRLAALAAAYGVLSGDFDEFRDKAAQQLGLKKTDEINHEIAKKKVKENDLPAGYLTPDGKSWFKDATTNQIFLSTQEEVKRAMNKVNFEANNHRGTSLNTFYDELSLENTTIGNILGWSAGTQCDLVLTPVLLDNGTAVTLIDFTKDPVPDF